MKIGSPFDDGVGGPGGWLIIDEPELHLNKHILVPDLVGWKKELFPKLPISGAHFNVAPQWICEILSPSTAGCDRVKKMLIYASEKVDHVWLIDRLSQTLEVFQKNEHSWTILKSFLGKGLVRAAPFDAIEFNLESLWFLD